VTPEPTATPRPSRSRTRPKAAEDLERNDADNRAYLAEVMAEIDAEVRATRASGDLPVRVERELDELFLQHSPVAGRGGDVAEALRVVDKAAFIDPVVPVESVKSGGAIVKKGIRSFSLWYVGYVTHQVSQFAAAVSRTLHLLDDEVTGLARQLDAQRVPDAPVVELPGPADPSAWWVPGGVAALREVGGRVLHAACGDGWLVRDLKEAGVDAYGVDPRPGVTDAAELAGTDLREEGAAEHLRLTESGSLAGVVLSGVVDGMGAGERRQLLDLVADRLVPDGVLVVHSASPKAWAAEDLPPEADLAPGRPLRAPTWAHLLGADGYHATVAVGPQGDDYLVVATRRGATVATPPG
jgi:SAM-dependent methyltransferase